MLRSILMGGAALIMLGAAAAMAQPSKNLPDGPLGDLSKKVKGPTKKMEGPIKKAEVQLKVEGIQIQGMQVPGGMPGGPQGGRLLIEVKGPIKKAEGPIKKAEGPIKARRVQAQAQAQVRVVARPVEPRDYWLGIRCFPVTPALRSQLSLPKKQGLLVVAVISKSPAMKAGLAPHDVLLRVGDKPLGEVRDLIAVIQETKDSKLKIALIRGGKRVAVEATLVKRPAEARRKPGPPPKPPELSEPADWKKVQKWLEGLRSDKEGQAERPSLQLRVFQPGAIVKDVLISQRPLPENMSVAISKEGNQPAKIVVRRGDKKWELTEKELGKLPANVRPFVEQMLGRGMPGKMQVKPLPPGLDQRLERRFDEMNRRMDRLFKMMEKMMEGNIGQPPESDD
ncbi:MAG: PDZ domain-containing protein [Pirellulales bacterium]|nr:PDZ domain-containing protein [Pirellulales bacterium]